MWAGPRGDGTATCRPRSPVDPRFVRVGRVGVGASDHEARPVGDRHVVRARRIGAVSPDSDRPPVRLDDLADDVEPVACPVLAGREARVEDLLAVRRIDPRSVVGDEKSPPVAVTRTVSGASSPLSVDRIASVPSGAACSVAFRNRFSNTCRSRPRSPHTRASAPRTRVASALPAVSHASRATPPSANSVGSSIPEPCRASVNSSETSWSIRSTARSPRPRALCRRLAPPSPSILGSPTAGSGGRARRCWRSGRAARCGR